MVNYCLCLPVFYLNLILVSKMSIKNGRKILPKDSKRMNLVQIFGILAARELLSRIRYLLFGLLMPGAISFTLR